MRNGYFVMTLKMGNVRLAHLHATSISMDIDCFARMYVSGCYWMVHSFMAFIVVCHLGPGDSSPRNSNYFGNLAPPSRARSLLPNRENSVCLYCTGRRRRLSGHEQVPTCTEATLSAVGSSTRFTALELHAACIWQLSKSKTGEIITEKKSNEKKLSKNYG